VSDSRSDLANDGEPRWHVNTTSWRQRADSAESARWLNPRTGATRGSFPYLEHPELNNFADRGGVSKGQDDDHLHRDACAGDEPVQPAAATEQGTGTPWSPPPPGYEMPISEQQGNAWFYARKVPDRRGQPHPAWAAKEREKSSKANPAEPPSNRGDMAL
jgi:hypothetical protein